jgi:O-antigen/teichoic acid export membrane protein
MKHRKLRRIIPALLAIVALTIVGLWSWNIVVELFNGPKAEYRHIVAIFAIATLLRAVLVTGRRHRSQETRQLHPDLKNQS